MRAKLLPIGDEVDVLHDVSIGTHDHLTRLVGIGQRPLQPHLGSLWHGEGEATIAIRRYLPGRAAAGCLLHPAEHPSVHVASDAVGLVNPDDPRDGRARARRKWRGRRRRRGDGIDRR